MQEILEPKGTDKIKITDGIRTIQVTRKAFDNAYSHKGWIETDADALITPIGGRHERMKFRGTPGVRGSRRELMEQAMMSSTNENEDLGEFAGLLTGGKTSGGTDEIKDTRSPQKKAADTKAAKKLAEKGTGENVEKDKAKNKAIGESAGSAKVVAGESDKTKTGTGAKTGAGGKDEKSENSGTPK